ncbi:MAG: hypothetical protein WAN16_09910 [Chthoniobacterales bacterium]
MILSGAPFHTPRHVVRRMALACALVLVAFPCRAAQPSGQGIKVPYALAWGDSVEKVREMLNAVKARETALSQRSPGRFVLEAEGLGVGDQLLKKSLFTFRDGSLVEVELQYGDPSWDGEKTLDFFDRTRRRIGERYGTGSLIVNKVRERPSEEKVPQDVTYTLIIYQWTQPTASLELDYYGVEGVEQALRLVSLHYKAP